MSEASTPRVLLDVPVLFDVVGGTTVHSPMVRAVVSGVETRLILDTGSTDHVLTRELLVREGVPMERGEDGTDHAGAPVASFAVGDLDISIDSVRFDLHDVVAIDGPPPFDGWGVGGFLSPQHVHPTARVLIDLVNDRLVLVEGGGRDLADIDAALAARVPTLRPVTLPRAVGTTTVAVEAAVDGGSTVATMLNTGGRGTEFARDAAPHLARSAVRRGGSGVSGAGVMGARTGPQVVLVGGIRVPVAELVVRDMMEDPPGLIGMDVLTGTALICSADRTEPVSWLVPPSWFGR